MHHFYFSDYFTWDADKCYIQVIFPAVLFNVYPQNNKTFLHSPFIFIILVLLIKHCLAILLYFIGKVTRHGGMVIGTVDLTHLRKLGIQWAAVITIGNI